MKIMSFNLLYGGKGNRGWKCRREMVVDTIRKEMPDTFGVQEAKNYWINALRKGLPEYDYAGVGRDDGKRKGEFAAVFYKKDKYTLLDAGTFWLSETPDVASMGWDADCIRICSWAKLKDRQTGKQFAHFNTHLDHIGQVAMQKGAELITEKIQEICPDIPVFLTGDFNVQPGSTPYKAVIKGGFEDTRAVAEISDDSITYHDDVFVPETPTNYTSIIDYCFKKGNISVKTFRVIKDIYPGNLYPSDHFPVVAEVEF